MGGTQGNGGPFADHSSVQEHPGRQTTNLVPVFIQKRATFQCCFCHRRFLDTWSAEELEHTGGHTGRTGGPTAVGDEIFIAFCISQTPDGASKDTDEDTPPSVGTAANGQQGE